MAKWIQSNEYWFTYGEKQGGNSSWSYWYPDYESLQAGLAEACRWLRRYQWKICAVTPLTQSSMYTDTSSSKGCSWGLGAGMTQIIGMVIFVQREIEITDEEYALRISALEKKARLETIKKELPGLRDAVRRDQMFNIQEEKGLCGVKFIVNDTIYRTREKAEEVLSSLTADCTGRAIALEAMQREFQQLSAEVQDLERKYGNLEDAW